MSKPPITITGVTASQNVNYGSTVHPLSGITVKDTDPHALVSAHIVWSTTHFAIDGHLAGITQIDGGRGGDDYATGMVTPRQLTAILRGITFAVPPPPPTTNTDQSSYFVGDPAIDTLGLIVTDGHNTTESGTGLAEVVKPAPVTKPHTPPGKPPAPSVAPHDPSPVVQVPAPHATLASLFNPTYYLNQNPDVAKSGVDPLTHYEQTGWIEGRDPSASFSTRGYLNANPDVAAAHVDPLLQYLNGGQAEGRMTFLATPHGVGPQNAMVDNSYYFGHNADILAAGVDPTAHYDTIGWKEGRDPSSTFSTDKYLAANADVKAAGVNPLIHYEQFGASEGRAIYHT